MPPTAAISHRTRHRTGSFERRQRARRLIELRINAGLSRSDLAYRAGVSAKTIRLAESGFVPGPRIQFAIARTFDLTPLELWPIETQPWVTA
jgi:DNA-binding XRE family transcriptional regulator